jgi:hypothetical protein
MQYLYSAVKASPILGTSGANIPVYHLTGVLFIIVYYLMLIIDTYY